MMDGALLDGSDLQHSLRVRPLFDLLEKDSLRSLCPPLPHPLVTVGEFQRGERERARSVEQMSV